jgi:hypothetical protein
MTTSFSMKIAVLYTLGLGALAAGLIAILADLELGRNRRDGASRWKVAMGPWRWFSSALYTEEGNRVRRRALVAYTVALALLLLGLAVQELT